MVLVGQLPNKLKEQPLHVIRVGLFPPQLAFYTRLEILKFSLGSSKVKKINICLFFLSASSQKRTSNFTIFGSCGIIPSSTERPVSPRANRRDVRRCSNFCAGHVARIVSIQLLKKISIRSKNLAKIRRLRVEKSPEPITPI
jgi:hypothetical protein